jgi:hypothetical protein
MSGRVVNASALIVRSAASTSAARFFHPFSSSGCQPLQSPTILQSICVVLLTVVSWLRMFTTGSPLVCD